MRIVLVEFTWQANKIINNKEYYKNGNIKFEGQYKDGEMHGKWTKYKKNKKGEVEEIQNYKDGELV